MKDIAEERGKDPFDTLLDIVIADDLRTVLWPMPTDNDADTWALRKQVWAEPDVLLGGSDAGAHLDRMCGAPYPTRFLGDAIRGRKLVPPGAGGADDHRRCRRELFGLRERGRDRRGLPRRPRRLRPRRRSARGRDAGRTTCPAAPRG